MARRKMSEKTKKRISIALKKRWADPESKAEIIRKRKETIREKMY
jgi:hypothetical protein